MTSKNNDPSIHDEKLLIGKHSIFKASSFFDFWLPILFSFSLYIVIRSFIAEARYIPSGSMLPGLKIQDRLLIEKITYRRRSPRRGEIVVFNSPHSFDPELTLKGRLPYPKCALLSLPLVAFIPGLSDPACDAYIKRVVAVPGDKVLVNWKGEVIINNVANKEPYVTNFCRLNTFGTSSCGNFELNVPQGKVLVLGDNRSNSWDSRFWPGGPFLPEDEIIGRAVWRFWPFSRFGSLQH